MGCDVHMILQRKEKGNWVDKEILDIDSNYYLFGVLAGIRGSAKPIAEPRGLPADFTLKDYHYKTNLVALTDWWDNGDERGFFMGDHSHSWLTLHEINKYKHWDRTEYIQHEFKDLFFRCPNLKRWRLVFGFDS